MVEQENEISVMSGYVEGAGLNFIVFLLQTSESWGDMYNALLILICTLVLFAMPRPPASQTPLLLTLSRVIPQLDLIPSN